MEGSSLGLFSGTTACTENLPGHQSALPVPAPEPSEVHLEDCLLEQSLAGQPLSELEQLEEVLLLLVALES
jgi:hypothetical protein